MNAVFVASYNSLLPSGGGVQLCTRDYRDVLSANFGLETIAFDLDQRFSKRLLSKLDGFGYRRFVPRNLANRIITAVKQVSAKYVFFNLMDLPVVAARVRSEFGSAVKLIHLSHGLDSTDIAIRQQLRRQASGALQFDSRAAALLGGKLQFEADYRRQLDGAICISPLDAELERWLGAPRTLWIGRSVREEPLAVQPVDGRAGCVATLDHIPNYAGLLDLLGALESRVVGRDFVLRLVGGPEHIGGQLAKSFPMVEYCGRLPDDALRTEAARWACFVHPVFAYARGCSTKVAVALGWQLPLATTGAGVRGYVWNQSVLPLASTPQELAELSIKTSRLSQFELAATHTKHIAQIQPTFEQTACAVAEFVSKI